ncbi:MAG: S9 family peptidase [Chloroflexota bacterium]|nr:S9 family peptidase [Chloroflexota bacterium]MBI5703783.1 S9 family peptidase [Chloroflexota bacterium]
MKPIAPQKPHRITQHGITRVDDYHWLRNREDPDTLKYLKAEMSYFEQVMSRTQPLQESLFSEMKGRIQETDSTVPEKRGGYWYYQRTEAGKQYPIFCRRRDAADAPEEILLDQNRLAEGKSFCSVSAFAVSPDGNKLAYAVDYEGNETYTIHILDLKRGQPYPETIPNTYGSVYFHTGVEWANDSETFFYITLDAAKRPCKLYRHRLGTAPASDVLLFTEEDETFFLFLHKTRDERYILTEHHSTTTSEMRYLSADQPDGEWKVIAPRRRGIEYYAAHHKGTFFILTNENAKNFKLMKAPVGKTDPARWQEIIPHRPQVMLSGIETFENHLVLYEYRDGLPHIRISRADGTSDVHYVHFPEPAYHFETDHNPDFHAGKLRIKYSSLVTPHTIVDIHLDSGEWEIKKEEAVLGYDKSQYVCDQIHATAPDGRRIPISIAYKKDLKRDGNSPALLHGYGAYGANLEPEFNASRISLLERGFVYAIAHVRGSSVLGREWYEDGKLLRKKNSFTDFIACAEHLIREGYTSKERLAILGVSAGGLLVTACMTMRPDLFKTVIAKVPFVDVINSMSDPSIPLTTHEYDEWGNPAQREQFEYMLSYSPYDNLKSAAYPHLLLTAGFNDPRVGYWEPAKFAAKLRELKTDDNLLLLKVNFNAGHAGASGRYDFLKEVAAEYAFLLETVNKP